jgi:hypothetical protein
MSGWRPYEAVILYEFRGTNLLPETSSFEVLCGEFHSFQAHAEILKLVQKFSFHIPSSSLFTLTAATESSTSLLMLPLLADVFFVSLQQSNHFIRMNFCGDNHAIIFAKDKCFGLVEIRQCSLESNKIRLRFKTSSAVIPTIHGT